VRLSVKRGYIEVHIGPLTGEISKPTISAASDFLCLASKTQ
jgi:hypothetical protein